jgi:hypothetical protein
VAKLELTDMQEDASKFLRKVQTKSKINLKVFSLVLILVITVPSAYFGYTVYAGPNYKGKTVEEVFKNREDQIAAVLAPACSVGKSEISAVETDIIRATESIAVDYHFALGNGVIAPSAGNVRVKIRNEVEKQLKAVLGDKYLRLDNESTIISSGEDSAIAFCQLQPAITGLRIKSAALDEIVNGITSPGSWAGSGYYYDQVDPNMAFKWAPTEGWVVDVISRLGCPDGSTVIIDGIYGDYSGNSGYIAPGEKARIRVEPGLSYLTESGSVESVACR